MRFLKRFCCLLFLCVCIKFVHAQKKKFTVNVNGKALYSFAEYFKTDSGTIKKTYQHGPCRNVYTTIEFIPYENIATLEYALAKNVERPKLLTIHGNISYDFIYRSKLDTPVSQQNFQQHTERINLDILVKEKYPLKVALMSRQSNSPYFRNFIDMDLHFDRYAYNKNLKQELIDKLTAKLTQNPDIKSVTTELNAKIKRYNDLKNWLSSGATLQKIIEEKERKFKQEHLKSDQVSNLDLVAALPTGKVNDMRDLVEKSKQFKFNSPGPYKKYIKQTTPANEKKDSILSVANDSSVTKYSFSELFNHKQQQLGKLEDSIKKLQAKADSIKSAAQKNLAAINKKIYKATSEKELKNIAKENGIQRGQKDKLETVLAGIKTFGIGRSMLNYTELTAQNITVTGVNIEYNPSWYAAFAAGKIDYRFRDFYTRNTNRNNNQYLVLGRVGIGNKDNKSLILSVFQGRKSTSQFGYSDSIKTDVNIMGYSLEGIIRKDAYTSISAEFAKSTKPVTGNLQANKQTGVLFRFSDYSNTGINIKAQTIIHETDTKLSGFYRRTGKSFQSFSLFSYNTDQTAWLVRADQPFFKTKVILTGMLRQNDFTNPFTDKTFKTSTTFKSVLLNVRIPKYPSLSVGYYPGTQLYFVDKEKIKENAYYILNGSIVYSYLYKGLRLNSSLLYNRYFNQATDSGFVLNKGVNYYASQSVFLRKMQVKAGYAYTRQRELSFYTLESSVDYALKSFLKIGSGIKRNKIIGGSVYWGPQVLLNAESKKLGGLSIQYEKSFLPTFNNTLVPIEIGRVSWYKIF